jgi:acetyl-CoA carboxylase carboxyl transferase subunit alpha
VADRVLILENAYYSVISPEGCAAILWKDRAASSKAAAALKITAEDLSRLGLVDGIIPEPIGGAHTDYAVSAANLKSALLTQLAVLKGIPPDQRLQDRYSKFRAFGQVHEPAVQAA